MTDNNTYDFAIVGGGLAGLCLSIQLAEKGRSVILFEKEQYPFHKVCGEYISMESWPFLEQLGIPLSALDLPRINRLKVTDTKGKPYAFPLPLGGFGISRFMLDNLLAERARQAGVMVMEGCAVTGIDEGTQCFTIATKAGVCISRLVAGTWGKRSNLDKQWERPFMQEANRRLSGYLGIKYHIRYEHPEEEIVLHNFEDGYCGMSRIEEGKSCLCYLVKSSQLKRWGSVNNMEEQLLGQNPALAHIFSNAERLYAQPLVISNISFEQKAQVEHDVLMAGDTAGLITPLCGNGMSMAMHASKLAGEACEACFSGVLSWDKATAVYEQQWKKQFSVRLRMGRLVQSMFGAPLATDLLLKTLNALPPLASAVIRSTHGQPF